MARTKDERFVICLYENASKAEDLRKSFNKYEIGVQIGLQPKAVNTICKLLIQANFIKKNGEIEIFLTSHGESLALRLLGEY
jgi:predicted transcriptional regulator